MGKVLGSGLSGRQEMNGTASGVGAERQAETQGTEKGGTAGKGSAVLRSDLRAGM